MLNRTVQMRHSQQQKWQWKGLCGLLMLSLTLSAIGMVYVRFSTRAIFNQWYQLQAQRDEMNVEWTQLMLERAALSAESRIDRIAQQSLHMRPPTVDETVRMTE